MLIESLEARTFMSADPHTVTVPLHAAATGNLPAGVIYSGHATHLGKFTGAFNADGVFVFTAADGDQLFAAPQFFPVAGTNIVHVEGNYVGGTGRFAGTTGTFTLDLTLTNPQGDFVYRFEDSITFQRPSNGKA
jgi:hypothetical protein